MRIATFNCNSIRQRLELILSWLEEWRPDLLALQETKVRDEEFPAEAFQKAGWQVVFRGEKSYNGVAMVLQQQPEDVRFGFDGEESATRLVSLRLQTISILNTYVPQGRALDHEQFQYKLQWFRRLRRYLAERFDPHRDEVLWVGDLNVAPTPIDVYDSKAIWPHVCHCQEVIDAWQEVVDWGFVDVFRKHLPQPGIFTFWDYRQREAFAKNRGWRVDHILATPPLASRSKKVTVDRKLREAPHPSDHTPVIVDFEPPYAKRRGSGKTSWVERRA